MALSECEQGIDENGRELLQHGSLEFPVAGYHDNLTQGAVEWHWHDEFEAVVVSEGEIISAGGSRREPVMQGDGFFINSGALHSEWQIGKGSCRFHSLVFHPNLVGGNVESVFWQDYLRPLMANNALDMVILHKNVSWQKEMLSHIEKAWQALRKETPGYEFIVRESLSRLIYLLYANSGLSKTPPSEREQRRSRRIKMMLRFIEENFPEQITVAEIAASAMLSESECLRCFKSTIGITPISYLRRYRLQRAAALLTQNHEKISVIGEKCGFQEMSYFAGSFRKRYGCTPSEYRKNKIII